MKDAKYSYEILTVLEEKYYVIEIRDHNGVLINKVVASVVA